MRIRYFLLFFVSLLVLNFSLFASFEFSHRNSTLRINSGGKLSVNSAMTNWDGTLDQRGTIVGSSIGFDGGILECQETPAFLRGSYDADATQQIALDGNKVVRIDSGEFGKKILVSSTGNRLEGQGLFSDDTQGSPNIELQDSGAALTLALQSKLNSFVALNGGTVTLEDDVHFSDERQFLGSGTVNLNNKRIEFGGSEFNITSTVTYVDATDIELHANINLSGQVAINGTGPNKIAYLNGHCYTIDLGSTGSILIKDGVTLYLTDICIKNLGDTLGKFIFETSSSSLRLKCVTLQLGDDYTISDGNVFVDGGTEVITGDKFLTFSSTGKLTVDGNTLYYDYLDFEDQSNIIPSVEPSANLDLLNNGLIQGRLRNLVKANSNAIIKKCDEIRHNSDAILAIDTGGGDNALAIANSNLLLVKCKEIENNSNAIVDIDTRLDIIEPIVNFTEMLAISNSNTILTKCKDIENNSNAIVNIKINGSDLAIYNSNLLLTKCLDIDANNELSVANSNLLLTKCKDIENNSNAIVNIMVGDSELAIANSNLLLTKCKDIENNSNAIVNIMVGDSELAIANSNLLLTKCKDIENNSNAIVNIMVGDSELAIANSNLLLTKCKDIENNSNAIVNIKINGSDLAIYNSNLLLTKCKDIENNSNAIVNLDNRVTVNEADIIQNAADIAINTININHNSNAILDKCDKIENNSNAIVSLDNRVTINEADILQNAVDIGINAININHNSNAILDKCDKITANSNAILDKCDKITANSNALLYCCKNNSNAIIRLRADLGTIDALVPDIDICSSPFMLMFDLWISVDNILTVQTKAGTDVCIDGRGHYIHFSRDVGGIFVIEPGLCVTTKNVVLKDFSDTVLDIQGDSQLKFGEGTVVELAECEVMRRDWVFGDGAILQAFGNKLELNGNSIIVNQDSTATLQDVCLVDVQDNNMRVAGNDGCIHLKEAVICLSRDYTFTTGSMKFEKDVLITGTTNFAYETCSTSTICSKSTLLLDKDVTFEYAPSTCDERDLIYMQDQTARFFWNDCTVKSSSAGMRLTRGTLCVDGQVEMINDGAASTAEGFAFGNSIADDDLSIVIYPAASTNLNSGFLSYDNVA